MLKRAIALADAGGIERAHDPALAQELDVKPMTIYHYVRNKEAILDGMVDLVFGEIGLPDPTSTGRPRCEGDALRRGGARPAPVGIAATGVTDLRGLRRCATTTRCSAAARRGMSIGLTAHAYAMVDGYVYGFALSEATLPYQRCGDCRRDGRGDRAALRPPARIPTSSSSRWSTS